MNWILGYLIGTSRVCLCYGIGGHVLDGYIDADMVSDIDSRKYSSGYRMNFTGEVVSWQSRLQKCVTLSTTEVGYIVATEASK